MTQRLGESTLDPTRLSASELARHVADGRLSAVEVVEAHLARIAQVNPRLNAIVILLAEQARIDAARADELQRRGEPLGPLHGVPVTVKESFHVAGTPSTMGIHRFATEAMPHDGAIVRRLRQSGAIVLGKTNVPQLMLLHETDNPLYGRTNNPWNLDRSSGGSSGGEAAIVAAGGSALGFGNDMGGSIRQPAHVCGIHGLKSTTGRLSNAGCRKNLRGVPAIGLQPGPLARHVADLELALRVLIGSDSVSDGASCAPVPLGDSADVVLDQLTIGYSVDDGYFAASPAIRRAVEEAAATLRSRGARVEPFELPEVSRAMRLYFGLIAADGAAGFLRLLGDSPRDWRIKRLLRIGRFPKLSRPALAAALRVGGQQRLAALISWTGRRSTDVFRQMLEQCEDYIDQFLRAMGARGVDVLLLPPHALPAPVHGGTLHLPDAASYCFLANLLHMPAGVVAATRVRSGEETDRPASRDVVERAALKVEQGSAGLPVGVQVMARHWREDQVLAVMQALESAFQENEDYPAGRPPF